MTTPAGWYPEGTKLRWWDGSAWTDHFAELPAPQAASPIKTKKRYYYLSNLLRWRFWQFTLFTSFLVAGGFVYLGAGSLATVVFLLSLVLVGWFWLTVQMACRHCGTVLRVTRLSGQQEVCHKCQHPTDRALKG